MERSRIQHITHKPAKIFKPKCLGAKFSILKPFSGARAELSSILAPKEPVYQGGVALIADICGAISQLSDQVCDVHN